MTLNTSFIITFSAFQKDFHNTLTQFLRGLNVSGYALTLSQSPCTALPPGNLSAFSALQGRLSVASETMKIPTGTGVQNPLNLRQYPPIFRSNSHKRVMPANWRPSHIYTYISLTVILTPA